MDNFERCNKLSGIHYLNYSIEDLKVKITIKSVNNVLPLPKLEHFISDKKEENLDTNTFKEYKEEQIFKWQEKVFSVWEKNFYSDSHNCTSVQEDKYHQTLKKKTKNDTITKSKLFTYVEGDDFQSESMTTNSKTLSLATQLEMLNLESAERLISDNESDSSSTKLIGLLREPAVRDLGTVRSRGDTMRKLKVMHIMLDWSKPVSESDYIIKRETLLASLWWDPVLCCLIIWPEVNDIIWNPYSVDVIQESSGHTYYYSLELVSDNVDDELMETKKQLDHFEKNLYRKLQLRRKPANFILPPQSLTRYYVTLQITSARSFEYVNLYVEYEVRFPSTCLGIEDIHGRTHVTRTVGKDDVAKYGHLVDFSFDYRNDDEGEPQKSPIVYFEVISRDSWHRHRTEGYCYCCVPKNAGIHSFQLSCSRPDSSDRNAEMRRFFVGGCHILEDVSWLAMPENYQKKTINKLGVNCISTGLINIQFQIMSQSQRDGGGDGAGDNSLEQIPGGTRMSADTLFQSVNVVLQQYRAARDRLWRCRGDDGSGEGTSSMRN